MNLTINCITRGRPERLLDTVERVIPKLALDSTKFLISVDADDQKTIDILPRLPRDSRIIPIIASREDNIGDKWNRALQYPADVYMPLGDYISINKMGFDRLILEANVFPDNIGVIYSHMSNLSFPSIWCVTHGLVEKIGYMCPPYFPYWFVDHWVDDIGKLIDRISFADFQTEMYAEKPPTQEYREPEFWSLLFDSLRLERRQQARSIIDSPDFQEPEWRKEILRRHYPLLEYKSQWINDHVRAQFRAQTQENRPTGYWPDDDRYLRLKAKSETLLSINLPALEQDMAA